MGSFSLFVSALFSDGDPSGAAVNVPLVFEFVAVLAGAVSGALTACDKKLDLTGVCVLAMVTSLGGGLVRDMILSNQGIYMLDHPVAVLSCIVVALLAFYFSGLLKRFGKLIAVFDILSVALFTFSGADKALVAGYGVVAGVLMGVLTGVGGGVVRDIIMGKVPGIFRPSNYYAVCSVLGAVVYCVLVEAGMVKGVAGGICVFVVVLLRFLSVHYNITTARPRDFSQKLFGKWVKGLDDDTDEDA